MSRAISTPLSGVGLRARDAVRIDDGRAFLALADVGAKFDGLAVGHPDRCGEALHAGRHPQRQNVDAGVGLAVVTQRSRNAPGGVFGVPGPDPRRHVVFESGDDLRGDPGVDVLLGRFIVLNVVVDGAGAGGRAGGTDCTGSPVTALLARPVRDRRPTYARRPRARKPALDDHSEGERQGRRSSSP